MAIPNEPLTRVEQYLNNIAVGEGTIPEEPLTRTEQYLDYIAKNGGGGSGGDPEAIASAVTDWLEENVDPVGSAVVVDSTLSIEGAAADAKATGDKIGELKSALTECGNGYVWKIISELTSTFIYEAYRVTTGHITINEGINIVSADDSETGYSFRIFNADGTYISSAWNTHYELPKNTEFYLLIRKSDASRLTEEEAKSSVYITWKNGLQKEIESVAADVSTNASAIEDVSDEIETVIYPLQNPNTQWVQGAVKAYSTAGCVLFLGAYSGKITVNSVSSGYQIAIYTYSDKYYTERTSDSGWIYAPTVYDVTEQDNDGYVVIRCGKTDRGDLTPEDCAANISLSFDRSVGSFVQDKTEDDSCGPKYIPLNLYNYKDGLEDGRISVTSGNVTPYPGTGAHYVTTDYFDVVGGTSLVFSTTVDRLALFDKYKRIIHPADSSAQQNITSFTLPENAAYARLSVLIGSINAFTVNVGTNVIEYTQHTKVIPYDNLDSFVRLPEYYHTDSYISERISTVKNALKACANNGDAFYFITDIHWLYNARRSPLLIKYLNQHLNIPRLFNGGDNYDGYCEEVNRELREAMGQYPVYHCDGNHEYLENETYSSVFYQNRMMTDNVSYGGEYKNYYYVDNYEQKIRYIVLAAFGEDSDGDDQVDQASNFYDNTDQLAWFTNTALNVEQGWTIIIITHTITKPIGNGETIEGGKTLCVPISTSCGYYIDAIKNYAGNGVIAAVIQGHVHRDEIRYIKRSNATYIPVVITTCDKYQPHYSSQTQEYDLNVTREYLATSEQAFECFVLDKENRTLTAYRIGAPAVAGNGSDNTDLTDYRMVSY